MKSGLTLTLFILLIFSQVSAQIDAQTAGSHVILKYSPLPMFDVDNTFQLGVEVPLGNSGFSLQQDLGYGHSKFNIWYQEDSSPPNKDIYKSRTQLRYYFYERRRTKAYVAGEYLFKKVVYRENQWVGMDCSGFGGCGYFENRDVKIGRIVGAGHIRAGWQIYFANRMTLDFFGGFGMRRIKVNTLSSGLENASVRNPESFWFNAANGADDFIPSLVLGVHFGLILGKLEN
ncbi:DUF3575 domain-containing protein [Dyadobacter sp. CY323]|uniref:DUF3575 domain-containing protein n=1 Tax=Dyadobacter sp. CY323 TaxID=2907302 RepID=UPI001F1DBF68|nr:DUF3575 domain-containing protein [Dyadobacter sp. CY323]MCE6992772.1 DUF3575 domain-containing protein [Dyadobacter sp. CY323]